jgi:hypothetical protein
VAGYSLFGIVVAVAFESVFCLEIYQNNILFIFKNLFPTSAHQNNLKTQKKIICSKKIQLFFNSVFAPQKQNGGLVKLTWVDSIFLFDVSFLNFFLKFYHFKLDYWALNFFIFFACPYAQGYLDLVLVKLTRINSSYLRLNILLLFLC